MFSAAITELVHGIRKQYMNYYINIMKQPGGIYDTVIQ